MERKGRRVGKKTGKEIEGRGMNVEGAVMKREKRQRGGREQKRGRGG